MDQSSEQSADRSMDQDAGRWLTYPELAAVRGIDKPSAIRLATRKKWRRQRDNRRTVRVLVPAEWLSPRYQSMDPSPDQHDQTMDLSSDRTDFGAVLAAVTAAHAGEVAALRAALAAKDSELAAFRGVIDRHAAEAVAARGQLAAALGEAEDARQQAQHARRDAEASATVSQAADAERDRLRVDLDTMREVLRQAQAAADALRQAEESRKGRRLVERLRAAWRGE